MHGLDMLIRFLAVMTDIRGHIPQPDRFEPFRDDSASGGGFGGLFGNLAGLVIAIAIFITALTGAALLASYWPS